jgi:hypothetical protein
MTLGAHKHTLHTSAASTSGVLGRFVALGIKSTRQAAALGSFGWDFTELGSMYESIFCCGAGVLGGLGFSKSNQPSFRPFLQLPKTWPLQI